MKSIKCKNWVCFNCGYINDNYKQHRKRREVQKKCIRCNADKPIKIGGKR